jgi:hypothetical protein
MDQYQDIKDMVFRSMPFSTLRYYLKLQVGSNVVGGDMLRSLIILSNIDVDSILIHQLNDKRDDFNFSVVNFPYLCNSIVSLITGLFSRASTHDCSRALATKRQCLL